MQTGFLVVLRGNRVPLFSCANLRGCYRLNFSPIDCPPPVAIKQILFLRAQCRAVDSVSYHHSDIYSFPQGKATKHQGIQALLQKCVKCPPYPGVNCTIGLLCVRVKHRRCKGLKGGEVVDGGSEVRVGDLGCIPDSGTYVLCDLRQVT